MVPLLEKKAEKGLEGSSFMPLLDYLEREK